MFLNLNHEASIHINVPCFHHCFAVIVSFAADKREDDQFKEAYVHMTFCSHSVNDPKWNINANFEMSLSKYFLSEA